MASGIYDNGCVEYLMSVKDATKNIETERVEVCVVYRFPNVYLEELPGLPPDQKIDFEIKLLLGTTPIFEAPYRIAPTELKQLKQQLQELLDKKFIRPSYFPVGSSSVVCKEEGWVR